MNKETRGNGINQLTTHTKCPFTVKSTVKRQIFNPQTGALSTSNLGMVVSSVSSILTDKMT